MLGRRSTSFSCAKLRFNKPETEAVVQKIVQIQAQVSEGSFVPDREHDILTKALGNLEHPVRTWGKGSKVPWKTGFPQDGHRYKSRRNVRQRRIDQFKAAFDEMYEEKKRKEREEQETLGIPPVSSNAGSVDQ